MRFSKPRSARCVSPIRTTETTPPTSSVSLTSSESREEEVPHPKRQRRSSSHKVLDDVLKELQSLFEQRRTSPSTETTHDLAALQTKYRELSSILAEKELELRAFDWDVALLRRIRVHIAESESPSHAQEIRAMLPRMHVETLRWAAESLLVEKTIE